LLQQILELLDHAGAAIKLVAVVIIVVGFMLAAVRYASDFRRVDPKQNFVAFKVGMGRPLLLGLEILVVSDVIETITTTPTYGSLAALGILVLIRTAVSWTLTLEIEGHWPWQAVAQE